MLAFIEVLKIRPSTEFIIITKINIITGIVVISTVINYKKNYSDAMIPRNSTKQEVIALGRCVGQDTL